MLLSAVVVLLYGLFALAIRLSKRLGFECLFIVFCFKSSAATVEFFVTMFPCWGVFLFSGSRRQPPLLGGIWFDGL